MSIVTSQDIKKDIEKYLNQGYLFIGIDNDLYILINENNIIALKK